jgi:hypothetical protein
MNGHKAPCILGVSGLRATVREDSFTTMSPHARNMPHARLRQLRCAMPPADCDELFFMGCRHGLRDRRISYRAFLVRATAPMHRLRSIARTQAGEVAWIASGLLACGT